jgi:hypothetical protein
LYGSADISEAPLTGFARGMERSLSGFAGTIEMMDLNPIDLGAPR